MIELASRNIVARIAEARRGLETGDSDAARLALHSIVTSAGNLGATEVKRLAEAGWAATHEGIHPLERVRSNHTVPAKARELLDRLEQVWMQTQPLLESERHGLETDHRGGGGQRG